MAVTQTSRRAFLTLFPLGVAALAGCGAGSQGPRPATPYEEIAHTASGTGKNKIIVLMPDTVQTQEVWTGLSDELGQRFELIAVRVESSADSRVIALAIARHAPSAVVLMNNPTVDAYRNYEAAAGAKAPLSPVVIVMTSFLEGQQSRIGSATGIYYEVPLITVVTNLRKLIAIPIERIGVIRRAPFASFVKREATLAAREHVTVVEEEVSASPNASELKRALRIVRERVDALWVLNDDKLLTPHLIADGWLAGVAERPWIPTLVGAASIVSPALSFGTFAVLPDHAALGVQAASLVFDIAENEWRLPESAHAQLPLSTTTTIDLVQVRERFILRPGALAQVDRILQ